MLKVKHRIAVVGFGSAGAATAILLAQQGHSVDLFERAASNEPVGAGFLLQPSGMKVLKDMGILQDLLPHVAEIEDLYCKNMQGKTMLDLPYSALEASLFGAGVHRGTFLSILENHAYKVGVNIRWNTSIKSFKQQNSIVLEGEQNDEYTGYDALIIADGAKSSLRSQLEVPQSVKKYPWGAVWYIGKRTEEFSANTLWQSVDSTDRLCGFLPTGTSEDLLSLFWSIRIDQMDRWREAPLDGWKSQVLSLVPQAESYLAQIHSHEQMKLAQYHDVVMPHWHDQSAVVIGDAAHALSPQLGQGVNLALLDAAELANQISQHPIDEALARYSKARKSHLAFYQRATRWTTPFFQSDYALLGKLRDLSFPIANKIPYFRREMVATMTGLKEGVFSSMPIEEHKNLASKLSSH